MKELTVVLKKMLKIFFRVALGGVFVFSGFVKAVDPLGFGYMISDYFTDAFGMPSLTFMSLTLSVILNALELLVGICLMVNLKPRLAVIGALIFLAIYTPLTLYIAIENPVQDCGCFGDAVKLTNWQTFFKNVIFLPMALLLFYKTKGETKTYKGNIDWVAALGIFGVSILFQVISLNHLPMMDFRPYKVGTYIPDEMIIPDGAKTDSFATVIRLRNVATKKIKEVDEATYMSNEEYWDETKWKADTTISVLVEEGYKPPVYNFNAYPVDFNPQGPPAEDLMDILLEDKGYSFFVISYDLTKADMEGFDNMAKLINYAYPKNIKAHVLTSTTASNLMQYKMKIKFPARYYNSDPITLETIIRANPGLLLMKEGTIIDKWHYNDIPSIEEFDRLLVEFENQAVK